MNWSFSTSRIFFQCPRKWYYQKFYADPASTDEIRKEAFFLSQLSNLRAWRGKLVDQVITRFVIPRLNKHEVIPKDEVLNFAQSVINNQLEFGKRRGYRDKTSSEFRSDLRYCAFFELEYQKTLPEENLKQCQKEINQSLLNLLDSEFLKLASKDGIRFIAQRTLKLSFAGSMVCCTPDLIAFFKSTPPMIVDWKVETPEYKDHWLQLGLYGVVLSRIDPHKDFPSEFNSSLKNPCNIDLQEFQLLRNQVHKYRITLDDVVDVENYVYSSAAQMLRFIDDESVTDPHNIPSSRHAESCLICNFKKICWRTN